MLGVKWCDHVKNVDVAAANGLPIIDEIKSRNALFGHIVDYTVVRHYPPGMFNDTTKQWDCGTGVVRCMKEQDAGKQEVELMPVSK